MQTKRGMVAATAASLVLAIAGCGGDDEDGGGETDSGGGTTAEGSGGATPTLDAVLACLKEEGLDAKDQSSNTGGDAIGIDYPGGRLVVSFEGTPEEAETYASVAEANGETAVVNGSVVITVPDDPGAETARPAVEGCVDSA